MNELTKFVQDYDKKGPWSPVDVIPIDSRKELYAQLEYYGVTLIRFAEPHERRYFMENIRPALRYYCTRYGVDIPEWLDDETHFGHGEGDPEYMEETFGVPQLKPATWDEWMFQAQEQTEEDEEAGDDDE